MLSKDIIKKLKLQRVIPKLRNLKNDAIKSQRFEEAYRYRELEKDYTDELRNISIKKLKKNRMLYLLQEECEIHKSLKHIYAKEQKFDEAFEHLLLEKTTLDKLDQLKKDLEI